MERMQQDRAAAFAPSTLPPPPLPMPESTRADGGVLIDHLLVPLAAAKECQEGKH